MELKVHDKAIICLTDMFGLDLVNPKIIADKYAEQLGCNVYVPDLFGGELVELCPVSMSDITVQEGHQSHHAFSHSQSVRGRRWASLDGSN